jgi:hypothetical protein
VKKKTKNKPLTFKMVENNFLSLSKVWGPLARKAIDDEFKALAKKLGVTQWRPTVKFTPAIMKKIGGNLNKSNYHAKRVLDELEMDIWEQDVSWITLDKAYEAMAKKLGADVEDTDVFLGACHRFEDAWNKHQREYALNKYGVDINFRN